MIETVSIKIRRGAKANGAPSGSKCPTNSFPLASAWVVITNHQIVHANTGASGHQLVTEKTKGANPKKLRAITLTKIMRNTFDLSASPCLFSALNKLADKETNISDPGRTRTARGHIQKVVDSITLGVRCIIILEGSFVCNNSASQLACIPVPKTSSITVSK